MKPIDPLESLRRVNGVTSRTEEQAQFANAAYGRIEKEPSPADAARDASYSNGGGYSAMVVHGRGDNTPFPENIASVSGQASQGEPEPSLGDVTSVPHDGFGDSASGVDAVTRGR